MTRDSARVSPTAHYTGYVWYRHGLSHEALRTHAGAVAYQLVELGARPYRELLGGPTLETILLQRHRIIDARLEEYITRGDVTQVVEIAAGLGPRGFKLAQRYPHLRVVEADLEAMSRLKRRILEQAGLLGDRHHVVAVDAMSDQGPQTLDAVCTPLLDPGKGTAVITEGLLNYFDEASVRALWRRITALLARLSGGVYLSDLHLGTESKRLWSVRVFRRVLGALTGGVHFHFDTAPEAHNALTASGFQTTSLHRPVAFRELLSLPPQRGPDLVRVVEANVGASPR